MNTLGILLEDGATGSYHPMRPPVCCLGHRFPRGLPYRASKNLFAAPHVTHTEKSFPLIYTPWIPANNCHGTLKIRKFTVTNKRISTRSTKHACKKLLRNFLKDSWADKCRKINKVFKKIRVDSFPQGIFFMLSAWNLASVDFANTCTNLILFMRKLRQRD